MSLRKTKLSRAQTRSRLRKGKRQSGSRGWTMATVAVVAVGAVAIFFSWGGGGTAAAPALGDHIHAYLGINVCGSWLPPAPEYESADGIHSHGDGLMHIHPSSSEAAGENAVVGRFIENNAGAGWELSATSMTLWDGVEYRNGQECVDGEYAGQAADIQWAVGRVGEPWDGTPRTGDLANYHPDDGDIVAVAFIPEGQQVPEPPDASGALGSPADVGAPAGGGGGHGAP